MTLLQGLKEMRKLVEQGKIVKDPYNLFEDTEGNEVHEAKDASCGCLMGISYLVSYRAGLDLEKQYIPRLDPFLWERDESCTNITKKGPKAMLEIIDAQIEKAKKYEAMENA